MLKIDLSIGQRIALGSGLAFALFLIHAALAQSLLRQIDMLEQHRVTALEPHVHAAIEVRSRLQQQAIELRTYALTRDMEYVRSFEQATQQKDAALAQLLGAVEHQAEMNEMRALSDEHDHAAAALIALIQHDADAATIGEAEHKVAAIRTQLLEQAQAFVDQEFREEKRVSAEVGERLSKMLPTQLIMAASVLFVIALTGAFTAHAVRQPAQRLLAAARAIGSGNYAPVPTLVGPAEPAANAVRRNELGELAQAFGRMAQALQQRERRLAADASLGAALTADTEIDRLSAGALREIAAYAACELGAIYLLDTADDQLQRSAVTAPDDTPARLPAEQGILGQALATGQPVVVREIPPDTPFRLRLGFGEVTPRTLVAIPIMMRGQRLGVMLLGSLRDLPDDVLDFIERAAQQLAISLQHALAHQAIVHLADQLNEKNEQLNEQNEQLQAQGEELQAQNEELQAQSEELQAQNEELQAQSDELQETNEKLERATQAKNEFLAMLAHELRNPLAPILNATHLLQRHDKDDLKPIRWASDIIERQVKQLAHLVDDLLDMARISRGKVTLCKERVDLETIVARAVETSRPLIVEHQHELAVILPPEPVWLEADPTRLAQVLSNLLNNAAKYSENGGRIRLTAACTGGEVEIRVRDTGIGIPPEMLPHVFDLFTQVDRAPDRSQGGLGIGLSLVKSLVEMHGGSVTGSSQGPGQGSEFTVRLPLLLDPPSVKTEPSEWTIRHHSVASAQRVLVVDDNVDVVETLSMVLRREHHAVQVAHDGRSAIQIAQGFRPDIVILDIGLPKMDGYEVARQLRADSDHGRNMLLIAMTGYGQEQDCQRALAAGFDHHLVKPVDLEVLLALLSAPGPRVGSSGSANDSVDV